MDDEIYQDILDIINSNHRILTTTDIENIINDCRVKKISRAVITYRLNKLWGERKINGQLLGGTRGVWIWWKKRVRNRKK